MPELVKKAAEVTSIGVQAGEGWLLTAEILELIESGCPNVVCAQPFACLPNHVTGRGMFGKIRRLHPEANIVSIDYDPGASEANQLNRIKLMIAAAKKAHNAKFAEPASRRASPPRTDLCSGSSAIKDELRSRHAGSPIGSPSPTDSPLGCPLYGSASVRGAVAQRLRESLERETGPEPDYRFFV